MAICDVCNQEVATGEGYLLTTRQVTSTPLYWEHAFNHQWSYYGKMDPEGKSLALTVRQQARQSSAWLICEKCIHLFNVDSAQVRSYCQKWWSSGQKYEPPGIGPGSFSEALEAAVIGWEKAFGKRPTV